MTLSRFLAACAIVALLSRGSAADAPVRRLPRATPEEEGVSSAAVLDYVNAADATVASMHSLMLVRHGKVVAEGWWAPYAAGEPHLMFSLSKSFTSTAVGLAVADAKLGLYDKVLGFFPSDGPVAPGKNLSAMRVRDLLRMSSGQEETAIAQFPFGSPEDLVRVFLSLPVAYKPGTHFVYNTPGTYMLSAIVQKATGQPVLDYLGPRLFEPLGIGRPTWDASAQGVSFGGFGLSLRTEDIACFGQLYLQRGQWNGRQLVPAAWVDAASSLQTSNGGDPDGNWDQGYGYQFWRCPHGFYRGDGAFGQLCIVMPRLDAVVAVTAGTKDMAAEMNLIWDRLVPALREGSLPPDAAADQRLTARLAALAVPVQAGKASSAAAASVARRRYVFSPNLLQLESIALRPAADASGASLEARLDGLDQTVALGFGTWAKGMLETRPNEFGTGGRAPIAASGAWTSEDTYTALICRYRTPVTTSVRLTFSADQVDVVVGDDLSLTNRAPVELIGMAAP